MSNQQPHQPAGNWSFSALLQDAGTAWRLLWDPNVPSLLKLTLPVLAMLYWLWPLDLIPGMPVDDIAVFLLAAKLFVALASAGGFNRTFDGQRTRPANPHQPDETDVIDTTWRVVDE